jgi:hypothetical protein
MPIFEEAAMSQNQLIIEYGSKELKIMKTMHNHSLYRISRTEVLKTSQFKRKAKHSDQHSLAIELFLKLGHSAIIQRSFTPNI